MKRKILLMVTVLLLLSLMGCVQASNESQTTTSSLSVVEEKSQDSQETQESPVESKEESVESLAEASVDVDSDSESSAESSLTSEEIEEIMGLLPEMTEDEILNIGTLQEDSIICYGKIKVNADFDEFHAGDLCRIIGMIQQYYVVYLPNHYDMLKKEFVDLLPLTYQIKEDDVVYGD